MKIMNIFVLDNDPDLAARSLCNAHVIKMVLESTQMLSTVAQLRGHPGCYKITHVKHPCVLWTARHPSNWSWLVQHAKSMSKEYTARYNGRIHACSSLIDDFDKRSKEIWNTDDMNYLNHTPFEQCMPDQYRQDDAVEAYRAYYIGEKAKFAEWKRNKPSWFTI